MVYDIMYVNILYNGVTSAPLLCMCMYDICISYISYKYVIHIVYVYMCMYIIYIMICDRYMYIVYVSI